MGDHGWDEKEAAWTTACHAGYSAPCAEDWALAVSGRRISSMLLSRNASQLRARLQSRVPESPFGFATHVHNEAEVLADPEPAWADPLNPTPTSRWLLEVGLTNDALSGLSAEGEWTGPVEHPRCLGEWCGQWRR
jgi:hypothetical protein